MRMLYAAKKRSEGEPVEDRYETMYFSSFLDQHDENHDCEPWLISIMKPTELFSEVEVTVSDFMRTNEFATLHDLDGTVLASDHRAALFHGFMPVEIVGKSPYKLVIEEDLQDISRSHQLILKEDEIPVTVYRVHSRLGPHVFLQTKSIIVCDKWTNQPKCIVSVHTAHRDEDGRKLLLQQRRRYSLLDIEKSNEETNTDKKSNHSSTSSEGSAHSKNNFSENTNNSVQNSHGMDNNVDCLDKNQTMPSSSESMCEIFEKEAKKYPDIYCRQLMSHKDRNASGSGVKRTLEEEDNLDESKSDFSEHGKNSANDFKLSSNSDESKNTHSKEDIDKDNKSIAEPSNHCKETSKLLGNDKISAVRKAKLKKPILKGLLEGQVTSYIYPNKGPLAMFMKNNEPDSSSASSIDDCQTCAGDNNNIGAADASIFQPSLAGTSDNDSDFKSNFVLQLHLKHTQLKDILFEQKNTVQLLRNQLALGTESVQLDPKNISVHNTLLGKILEAENQIDTQAGLLREIEEELKV